MSKTSNEWTYGSRQQALKFLRAEGRVDPNTTVEIHIDDEAPPNMRYRYRVLDEGAED